MSIATYKAIRQSLHQRTFYIPGRKRGKPHKKSQIFTRQIFFAENANHQEYYSKNKFNPPAYMRYLQIIVQLNIKSYLVTIYCLK